MTTPAASGLGPFTGLVAALQPRTPNELLQDAYQLLDAIAPVLEHTAADDLLDQLEDLRDEIITHLGNPDNH